MTHFGGRKTRAERDAINKRAAEWPRPLSTTQAAALRVLGRRALYCGRGGWHGGDPYGSTGFFSTQTVDALAKRGLCSTRGTHWNRSARITAAGRRELARRR